MIKVGVVVLARNEGKNISKCLISLVKQRLKPDKIIVVNDGSTDNTMEKIMDIKRDVYSSLIVIDIRSRIGGESLAGKPRMAKVVNEGLLRSLNYNLDYIMITGADCVYPEYYVKLLVNRMNNENYVLASGVYNGMNVDHVSGSGRIIERNFLGMYGGWYPVIYGWEDDIIFYARRKGYRSGSFKDIKFEHLRKLGSNIDYYDYGIAVKALEYSKLRVIGRGLKYLVNNGLYRMYRFYKGYIFGKVVEDDLQQVQRYNREFMKHYRRV